MGNLGPWVGKATGSPILGNVVSADPLVNALQGKPLSDPLHIAPKNLRGNDLIHGNQKEGDVPQIDTAAETPLISNQTPSLAKQQAVTSEKGNNNAPSVAPNGPAKAQANQGLRK